MKTISMFETNNHVELTIRETGSLDGYTSLLFKDRLSKMLENHKGDVCLDLTQTDMIDIASVNAIMMAHRKATQNDRAIRVLSNTSNGLKRWLHLTKFNAIISPEYSNN